MDDTCHVASFCFARHPLLFFVEDPLTGATSLPERVFHFSIALASFLVPLACFGFFVYFVLPPTLFDSHVFLLVWGLSPKLD